MMLRSVIRTCGTAVALVSVLAGCSDLERASCEDDYSCRMNFGVGAICDVDQGFCVNEPPPAVCAGESTGLLGTAHIPADIFENVSARRSFTIGVIVDSDGSHLASATKVAVDLANLKGGIVSRGPLKDMSYSAIVCNLDNVPASAQAQAAEEATRYLRDRIGVQVIVSSTRSAATADIIKTINRGDREMILVSANVDDWRVRQAAYNVDSRTHYYPIAPPENAMLDRTGHMLVNAREELEDGPAIDEVLYRIGIVSEAGDGLVNTKELENRVRRLERAIYDAEFANDPTIKVRIGIESISVSCPSNSNCVPSSFTLADYNAFVANPSYSADDIEIRYTPDGTPITDNVTRTGAIPETTQQVNYVVMNTDTSQSVSNLLEVANTAGAGNGQRVRYVLPPAAFGPTIGIFAISDNGETVNPYANVFDLAGQDDLIGLRPAADPSSPLYSQMVNARDILAAASSPMTYNFFPQAYDSLWVALAGIAGAHLTVPNRETEREAFRQLSGTRIAMFLDNRVLGAGEGVLAIQSLDPARWKELFVALAVPDRQVNYLFNAASGTVKMTIERDETLATPRRTRVRFDFAEWSVRSASRATGQPTNVFVPAAEGLLEFVDSSHCPHSYVRPTAVPTGGRFICPADNVICHWDDEAQTGDCATVGTLAVEPTP